jgi:hypothetical protein
MLKDTSISPGMVVHACDPSIWKAEAGGSLIQSHLVRYCLKKKKKKKEKQELEIKFRDRVLAS